MPSKPLGPGPGAYMLPSIFGAKVPSSSIKSSPKFSFGKKTEGVKRKSGGPGPGAYNVSTMSRYGKGGRVTNLFVK